MTNMSLKIAKPREQYLCTNTAIDLGEAKCFHLEVIKAFQNRISVEKKSYIVKIEYFFKVIYFSCSLDDGKNILTY